MFMKRPALAESSLPAEGLFDAGTCRERPRGEWAREIGGQRQLFNLED
jgi:hypothetical protein